MFPGSSWYIYIYIYNQNGTPHQQVWSLGVLPQLSEKTGNIMDWRAIVRDEFRQKNNSEKTIHLFYRGLFSNDQDILHPQRANHLKDDQNIVSRQSVPTDVQQFADAKFAWLMVREMDIRDLTMYSSTSPLLSEFISRCTIDSTTDRWNFWQATFSD